MPLLDVCDIWVATVVVPSNARRDGRERGGGTQTSPLGLLGHSLSFFASGRVCLISRLGLERVYAKIFVDLKHEAGLEVQSHFSNRDFICIFYAF